MSYVKQDLIKPHDVQFNFAQSSSVVESCFFSNRRVSLRFDAINTSITSHLYIQKLFLSSNFTTSILNGCGFTDFTVDVPSPAIFSTDSLKQCKSKWIRSNKLDKDRIFSSTRNRQKFSEAIYSSELIPRAIQILF